jgi:putative restriction endonuclease
VVPAKYLVVWPAYVVGDDPRQLTFTVQVDDADSVLAGISDGDAPDSDEARRRYVTATFRRRVHQRAFRERVLAAYQEQCAMCRLRHHELLDAAHIIADSHERGEPRIGNGLALCKIHHAAFDGHFLGVRPDYQIEVRRDILEEKDGPMLRYGLQEMNGRRIVTPRRTEWRPDRGLLEERYAAFRLAG